MQKNKYTQDNTYIMGPTIMRTQNLRLQKVYLVDQGTNALQNNIKKKTSTTSRKSEVISEAVHEFFLFH